MPAEPDRLIGRTLAGKYRLDALLGEGAMGRIYQARHQLLDKDIAIKVLHQHLGGEDRVAKRFHREARAASRLSHTNSVQTLDFGSTDDGVLYIAMELLDGEDLQVIIDHDFPFSPRRIGSILGQALQALDEAHHVGIIHRDLKPENIVVMADRQGRDLVKVCDFGIAKIMEGEGQSITVDGFVCGTPQYMAPEQARGEDVDRRLDIYAAGVVLYQMLVGVPPFSGETALGIITKHLTDEAVPPRKRKPELGIPESLERIAKKAMSKARGERYATAKEMSDALEAAIDALGPAADVRLGEGQFAREGRAAAELGGSQTVEAVAQPARVGASRRATWLAVIALLGVGGAVGAWALRAPEPRRTPMAESGAPTTPTAPTIAPSPSASTEPDTTTEHDVTPGAVQPPTAPEAATAGNVGAAAERGLADGVTVEPHAPSTARTTPRTPHATAGSTPATSAPSGTPAAAQTSTAPASTASQGASGSERTPAERAFEAGRQAFFARDFQTAIRSFEEAARLSPSDANTQKQLARAYMRAGDITRGVAAYRRYLELAPNAADRQIVESIIAEHP